VLGWGGYWAWDPVETANLIPWIGLTAFLHAQAHNRKKDMYVFIAPLLAVMVFIFTIFATFETRSGYVVSVLHAFTGPTAQILDPGEKLISLLQTNAAASFFITVMLTTLLVTGILFLWRFVKIRQKEGRLNGTAGLFPYAYIGFLAILVAYVLVDVTSFVSFGLSAAETLGMGNQGAGAAILILLLIGIPIAWIFLSSEEREEEEKSAGIASVVNDRNLMIVTVTIFSIWFSITILLMLMGVGGLEAAVFEDRLPLILIPLFIALTACLVWRYLGRQRTLYAIGLLVIAAIIGYAILPNKVVGLYIAVVLVAIVASCYRIVRTARPGKSRFGLHEFGGVLLVVAGLVGMITWSNPGRLSLLVVSLEPGLAYAPIGFIFSVMALVGGVSALGSRSFMVSAIGAILAILSIGHFFIALILGLVGLASILYAKDAFHEKGTSGKAKKGKSSNGRVRKRRLMPLLRSTGAHVIHFGVALLVIGYVASTYLVDERDFNPNPPSTGSLTTSAPVQFNDYSFQIDSSEGTDTDGDGLYENMKVHVRVLHNGADVGRATMEFYWMIPPSPVEVPHYMINIYVLPTTYEDVYFIGYAFRTQNDGWIQVREETGRQFTSADVTEVAFQVRSLPLMSALWGGMWIMTVGIAFVLIPKIADKRAKPKAKKQPETEDIEKPSEERETRDLEEGEVIEGPDDKEDKKDMTTEEDRAEEKDYDKTFEDELKKMGDEE
jgi:hypothetical protein